MLYVTVSMLDNSMGEGFSCPAIWSRSKREVRGNTTHVATYLHYPSSDSENPSHMPNLTGGRPEQIVQPPRPRVKSEKLVKCPMNIFRFPLHPESQVQFSAWIPIKHKNEGFRRSICR